MLEANILSPYCSLTDHSLTELLNCRRSTKKAAESTEHVCHFEYNTPYHLPSRYSLDYDHWGYFNGEGSSKGSYIPQHEVHGYKVDGADRTPHFPQSAADMLTDIVYKGGGRKKFVYESNMVASSRFHGQQPIRGRGSDQTNHRAIGRKRKYNRISIS